MTKPLALVFYESLLPGSQLVNRLQDLSYRVVTHTEAPSLMAQVKEAKPFLLVMDLTSENPELCRIVRELKLGADTGHIPILAFARDSQDALRAAALEAGATLVAGDVAILAHLPELLEQVLEVEP